MTQFPHRWLGLVVALLLGLLRASHAQSRSASTRITLNAFRVTFGPLETDLSYTEQLLVRYELEQILSGYFKDFLPSYFPGSSVSDVSIPGIAGYATSEDNFAMITFIGFVTFAESSTIIPTATDMAPLLVNAFTEDEVVSALRIYVDTISSFTVEPSLYAAPSTAPPTLFPVTTVRPTTLSPSRTPTRKPTELPTPAPFTKVPTAAPSVATTAPTVATASPTVVTASPTPEGSMSLTAKPSVSTSSPTAAATSSPPSSDPTQAPVVAANEADDDKVDDDKVDDDKVDDDKVDDDKVDDDKVDDDDDTVDDGATPVPTSIPVAQDAELAVNNDSMNGGTIAGAVSGAVLVLLAVIFMHSGKNRESTHSQMMEDSVSGGDLFADGLIFQDTAGSSIHPDDKESPARTLANSSMEERDVALFSHADKDSLAAGEPQGAKKTTGVWASLFRSREKEEPPNLAMTDGSGHDDEEDQENMSPDADNAAVTDLYRDILPGHQSPNTVPDSLSGGGQSISGQSMESFERQPSNRIRKDMLESADFAHSGSRDLKARQAWVHEEQYDCILTPTDISAATLARTPKTSNPPPPPPERPPQVEPAAPLLSVIQDNDNDTARSPMTFEEPTFQDEVRMEATKLKNNVSNYLASFLGRKQQTDGRPPRPSRGTDFVSGSTDNDTFGMAGDWDPDDDEETRSVDTDVFEGLHKAGSLDEQSLLQNRERSNESYQLQRLRTPPQELERRQSERTPAVRLGIQPVKLFSRPKSGDVTHDEQSV